MVLSHWLCRVGPTVRHPLAPLLVVLITLVGCAGQQTVAPPELAFGPGDGRALVLVGISAGQRDGTVTFTKLTDGANRLISAQATEAPVEFSVSNKDAATVYVVAPGRYVVSEAAIVTHRGSEYRSGFHDYTGFRYGHHGFHPYHFHHGWYHDWGPRRISVTEGERFALKNGPHGIENQSWIITVPPGQVTALGHFAFEWNRSSNVLNVAQTPFTEAAVTQALAVYPRVTAAVVEAEWDLYGPDLPPPPMMRWSTAY